MTFPQALAATGGIWITVAVILIAAALMRADFSGRMGLADKIMLGIGLAHFVTAELAFVGAFWWTAAR